MTDAGHEHRYLPEGRLRPACSGSLLPAAKVAAGSNEASIQVAETRQRAPLPHPLRVLSILHAAIASATPPGKTRSPGLTRSISLASLALPS